MKKILDYIVPILFLSILLTISVCYFIVPDKEISKQENRALALLPEFSLKSVTSGEFTDNMINYMNDQFPFRNTFVTLGDKINDLLHLDTQTSDGAQFIMNAGNAGGGAGEILGGTNLEIERKEIIEHNTDGTTFVIDKKRAMQYFSFTNSFLDAYAAMLNKIAVDLPDVKVYSLLVPTSSEFYLSEKLKTDSHSQKKAIERVYKSTTSNITEVDAYKKIEEATKNKDNYIYFRTDHHWTAKGAYQAYSAFCEAAGITPIPLTEMPVSKVEGDFYGSFTRLTTNDEITNNPDYIEYYLQPQTKEVIAFTNADMKISYDTNLFVDPGNEQNKYMVFLGGDNPVTRIITNTDSEKTLLILKDSFGNALTPFLVNHYKYIYVLDPRTVSTDLRVFCKEHNVDDLLIETYVYSLATDGARMLIETLF